MQECEEVTHSTSCRKRRKRRSFRFSTMKELKKAREYKSKMKPIGGEASSVQMILELPQGSQLQQDLVTVSNCQDGYHTPHSSTVVVESDDDEGAGDEDEDDNPRAEITVVSESFFNCSPCARVGGAVLRLSRVLMVPRVCVCARGCTLL